MNRYDSLAIDVSQQCNLKCSYCFETAKGPIDFPPVEVDAMFQGIDYFLDHLVSQKARTLHFHFGRREPLLNFPILVQVVTYLAEKGRRRSFQPRFHLTTNGTICNPPITAFLAEHDFDLRISIDGPSQIHDGNRKYQNGSGSFANVAANLRLLQDAIRNLTINSVYHPGVPFKEVLDFFWSSGIRRVDFFPLWLEDAQARNYFQDEHLARLQRNLESLSGYLRDRCQDRTFRDMPRIVQIEKYLQYICGFRRSPYYCGAGRTYLGLSGRGDFYPCLKFINSSRWLMGDCHQGINHQSLENYYRFAAPKNSRLSPCNMCSIQSACKGICFVDRLGLKNCRHSLEFYCTFQRGLCRAAEILHYQFKAENPEALLYLAGLQDLIGDV